MLKRHGGDPLSRMVGSSAAETMATRGITFPESIRRGPLRAAGRAPPHPLAIPGFGRVAKPVSSRRAFSGSSARLIEPDSEVCRIAR